MFAVHRFLFFFVLFSLMYCLLSIEKRRQKEAKMKNSTSITKTAYTKQECKEKIEREKTTRQIMKMSESFYSNVCSTWMCKMYFCRWRQCVWLACMLTLLNHNTVFSPFSFWFMLFLLFKHATHSFKSCDRRKKVNTNGRYTYTCY